MLLFSLSFYDNFSAKPKKGETRINFKVSQRLCCITNWELKPHVKTRTTTLLPSLSLHCFIIFHSFFYVHQTQTILEELEQKAMATTIPILELMPVGFRFRPTDEELVDYYLKHKLLGDDFLVDIIPDIDLCKVEPGELPGKKKKKTTNPSSSCDKVCAFMFQWCLILLLFVVVVGIVMLAYSVIKSDDQEWFFFSRRDYKYVKSTRSNRATNHGFWKATGQDRNIKARGTNNVIGIKKTLVFYEGRASHGVKTNFVIHEYHATTFDVSQVVFEF